MHGRFLISFWGRARAAPKVYAYAFDLRNVNFRNHINSIKRYHFARAVIIRPMSGPVLKVPWKAIALKRWVATKKR